jgi:hypothetical protein
MAISMQTNGIIENRRVRTCCILATP